MIPKFAVITTEFLKKFVDRTFEKLQMKGQYEMYIYHRFQDIPDLYRKIPDDIHGVLTSGVYPAQVVWLNFPATSKTIVPFNTDDAAIYRLFLKLLYEDRSLDFSRIYADVVDNFRIDLKTYLLGELSTSLPVTTNQFVGGMSLDQLYQIEESALQKHLRLWESGKVDLCVTRFSSIIEELKNKGVRAYFPFPSQEYLDSVCQQLFQEMELRHLQKNQSASIIISILSAHRLNEISFEQRCSILRNAITKLLGGSPLDYLLRQNRFGIEILTNRQTISNLTCGGTTCRMKHFLLDTLDFPICIGYGIGQDLYHARINAQKANRESELHADHDSFLVDDQEHLIGPLGSHDPLIISSIPSEVSYDAAKKSSLSSLTVQKILTAFQHAPKSQLTSQELADRLSITQRSANRYLSSMEKTQILEIVGERRITSKGRPERIYQIKQK